jgi:hypothetical protein
LAPLRHLDRCHRCLFIGEELKGPARDQTDAIDPSATFAVKLL